MAPTVSLIWAMADDRVIGRDNGMPWHLPADLRWFREATQGKPVVMGRRTFDSLGGRPLPRRTNIVVTRDPGFSAEGVLVAHGLDAALKAAGDVAEVMIIGGAELYAQALPRADRLYMTRIHAAPEGDARFPEVDWSRWEEVERVERPADADNAHDLTFLIYERRPAG